MANNVTIQVQRRKLVPPDPSSVEPRHDYVTILTTRPLQVKSHTGVKQFARVDIGGKQVTHVFTIVFTTINIDVRDRLRNALGNLWQILAVENVDLANQRINLHCADQGFEGIQGAR